MGKIIGLVKIIEQNNKFYMEVIDKDAFAEKRYLQRASEIGFLQTESPKSKRFELRCAFDSISDCERTLKRGKYQVDANEKKDKEERDKIKNSSRLIREFYLWSDGSDNAEHE